jgi:glycerophosphoryl diester phosphodiesterase
MSILPKLLMGVSLGIAALWANNTSLFETGGTTKLLAHRGVHQIFPLTDLDRESCTATRIGQPTHQFIENTIASMQAAFAAGAEIVELDVHLTPDKQFAVFHDWRLECRTNGIGVTEETLMADLQKLDVGYGYTADAGKSFPLRGKNLGAMPTLDEIMRAFPGQKFLINFKSRRVEEGVAFATLTMANPQWQEMIFGVYGGQEPTREAMSLVEGLAGYDRKSLMDCGWQYFALGWSGYVPEACRNRIFALPLNFAPYVWGWPHVLNRRLEERGSKLIVLGPYSGGGFSSGIDTPELLDEIPPHFNGYIWTNRIELIGPLQAGKQIN